MFIMKKLAKIMKVNYNKAVLERKFFPLYPPNFNDSLVISDSS